MCQISPNDVIGTTSACAENTQDKELNTGLNRNYLRVRGEYSKRKYLNWPVAELPPRARRIRWDKLTRVHEKGTTSACAENTFLCLVVVLGPGNYLRVRGEYGRNSKGSSLPRELPPRARRIPFPHHCRLPKLGTTSACAENTVESA